MNRFLFSPVNGRAAAWLRLAFAVALPCFFWSTSLDGPSGAGPLIERAYDQVLLSPGYWSVVTTLCVVLAAGYRPRLVAGLLLLMLLPLDFVSEGRQSRQVMLSALLAFAFLRSDVVRIPWGAQSGPVPPAGPSWPVRLMQAELSLVYGANALAKSSPAYLSGDVLLGMAAALPNFRLEFVDGMLPLGPLLVPVGLLAVGSTVMEYALALGFWWPRARRYVALLGLGFHLALTLVLEIYMLDLATLFLYLAFLLPLADTPGTAREDTTPPGAR